MAREEYDIVIKNTGAREVKRNLDQITGSARNATNAFSKMQNAISFAFSVYGLNTLRQYADGFVDMTSKLRVATSGVEELTRAEDQLFQISQRTYSGLSETVDLYTRLERSTRGLGLTQDNLLQVTEAVNKAVQLSGASAQAANASIVQLGQGLAAGALRGDELRSVLEQTPVLAQAIANGMGVAVGKLKALGTEGALTTDVVLNALAKSTKTIESDFSNVILTVSKGFTTLNNAVQRSIGQLDREFGISGAVSQGLTFIATKLDDIAAAALVAATGIALLYAPTILAGLKTAAGLVNALTVAIARNPLGALAVGVTAAVTALTLFRDEIQPIEGSIASIGDIGEATFATLSVAISGYASQAVAAFRSFYEDNSNLIDSFSNGVLTGLNSLLGFAREVVNFWVGMGSFLVRLPGTIVESWKANIESGLGTIGSLFGAFTKDLDAVVGGEFGFENFKKEAAAISNDMEDISTSVSKLFTESITTDYVDEAISAFKTGLDGVEGLTSDIRNKIITDAEAIAKARIAGEKAAQEAYEKTDQFQIKATDNTDALAKKANEALGIRMRLLSQLQSFEGGFGYDRAIEIADLWKNKELENIKDIGNAHAGLADLIDEVYAEKVKQAYTDMLEASDGFMHGVERTLIDFEKQSNDFGNLASNGIESFANNASSAIVDFARTGKLDFGNFAAAVAEDILMITTRMLIMKALASSMGGLFGFSGGGMVGDGVSTAGGGPVYAASGGLLNGPGGTTSDSINARLSAGEYIVNAAATKRFLPLLESINSQTAKPPATRFFNTGGMAGGSAVNQALAKASGQPQLSVTGSTIIVEGDASERTVEMIEAATKRSNDDLYSRIVMELQGNGAMATIVRGVR